MLVNELLLQETLHFHTIEQDASVDKALSLMSTHAVSSLIVTDTDKPVGIFTERDILRCHVIFTDTPLTGIPVRDVMTSNLIVAQPGDEIKAGMGMMIKSGIRHLPVVRNGSVVAVLALEDLVKYHIGALSQEIHYLKEYISDLHDAAHD